MSYNPHQFSGRPIDALLAKYSESHRHPTNEIIHFICVPLIVFALLGLIWSIYPQATVWTVLTSLAYYFFLSVPLAIGMLLMTGAMLVVLYVLPPGLVLPVSITMFVVAWIGQFIGHKIEGKKPSFFQDLRFLLIGPLFVLSFIYRRLHIAF